MKKFKTEKKKHSNLSNDFLIGKSLVTSGAEQIETPTEPVIMKPKRKAKAKPKPKPVEEESIKDIEETTEVSQNMTCDKAKYMREYRKKLPKQKEH